MFEWSVDLNSLNSANTVYKVMYSIVMKTGTYFLKISNGLDVVLGPLVREPLFAISVMRY